MANSVQIKRYALEANIPAAGYLPGEFMVALNTQKLFLALTANTKMELTNNSVLANYLLKANNLSDLTDIAVARTNLDVYSKGQVDNLIAGINWKPDVLVVTVGNIALTGLQTLDGVLLTAGARVGVVKQTNATENGIYIAAAGAWSRSSDANTAVELAGATFAVAQGTTMAETIWRVYTDNIIIGTTNIDIQLFNGIKALVAGFGIKFVNGNEIELDLTELNGTFTGLDAANDEVIIIDVSAAGTSKMRRMKVTQFLSDAGMVSDTYKVMNMAGSTPKYLDDVIGASEGVKKDSNAGGMTLKLAINDLTAEVLTEPTADVLVMYDNSAGAHRKITIQKAVENVAIDCGSY